VQALQTLRSFEFSAIYIIAFLPYCVYYYLQHESRLVKIETVLTVSDLLSKLISKLNENDSRSLVSIISCVLRKLLICAITDQEADVRYHVLNSLNSNSKFNMFISLPEDLNILFMCVRDERVEIRELAAIMISRLSNTNSAYILPFIRKILYQLQTEVDIYPDISQREKSVRLMGHLLCHASRLVNLYNNSLLDCLQNKLTVHRNDVPFASSIITVVGQLASQSNPDSIQNFDTVIPFLIESMQNFYYVKLKNISLWALGQIIANTGYVIEPYKKYPHLLEILFNFLQNETSVQIRRETIRILGLLGAIDPFEYKRALKKSKQLELEAAASLAAQQVQLKLQQHPINHITPIEPGQNNQNIQNNVVNAQPGATATAQASAISLTMTNSDQNFDPIEMMITMNSLDDFYPALAINIMMKIVKNSVSISVRKDAIQALVFVARSLDTRCVNYIELIIPPFLDMISKNDNLVIDLISQLGSIISVLKKHVEPYLSSFFGIIDMYWHSGQDRIIIALIDLIQHIANVMDTEFKQYLPRVLPLILKQLQKEIMNSNREATLKMLGLLRSITNCLENFINLILVQFTDYLLSPELNQNIPIINLTNFNINTINKQDLMFTIYTFARHLSLSDNCAILFQCFIKILEKGFSTLPPVSNKQQSNIPILSLPLKNYQEPQQTHSHDNIADAYNLGHSTTEPILSMSYLLFLNARNDATTLTTDNLDPKTDLVTLTLETLYLLARQLGNKYFVFASMFDKILIKNKSYSKLNEQLLINSRESSFYMYWNDFRLLTGKH
jgi:FKBP12-rapamycin complex-associated protein